MRRYVLVLALLAGCGTSTSPSAPTSTTTTAAVPKTTTSNDAICRNDRRKVEEAKAARVGNLSDPATQAKLNDAARQARADGCDISDLVGPNVGT